MSSPKSQPQTTTTTNELPDYVKQQSQANISTANAIAAKPWTGYSGQQLAGWTPEMNQAAQGVNDAQGAWKPLTGLASTDLGTAGGAQTAVANQEGPGDVGAYMNPRMQAVIDSINRNAAMQNKGIMRGAAVRGAAGSDAQGVQQAQLQEGTNRNVGLAAAESWDKALGASQAQQQLRLAGASGLNQTAQSLAGLASTGQNLTYQDLQALMGIGTQKRQDAQYLLEQQKQQFNEARDWDLRGLNIRNATLQSAPYEHTSQQTSNYYPGSTGAGILGGAAAGAGTGAMVGGPWGAAIGGVLGGAAGAIR